MIDEATIERAAKAIWEVEYPGDMTWEELNESVPGWRGALSRIELTKRKALAALTAAGGQS